MWSSLCNFLYGKLFYKPETESGASTNDSSVEPLYGKRLKLSQSDCDTNDLLNQTQTPQKFPMQAKEKYTNDDDDEECCVIAEIPRRKVAEPSSTGTKKYSCICQNKSLPRACPPPSSSLQRQPLQRKDESKDIEIIKCTNNSNKKDVSTKTPDKTNKFFNTQRSSLSNSKMAKSRVMFKLQLRKKLNVLQESYRLNEKLQYMELLQSHTSFSLLPVSLPVQNRFEPETIPIIDLTREKSTEKIMTSRSTSPIIFKKPSEDQDVQIIREIPVRSFQDIIKIRPVDNKVAAPKTLTKHPENSPEVLDLTGTEQDAITLIDEEDDNENKDYSESLGERLRKFMQITGPMNQEVENYLDEQFYFPELTPEEVKKVEEALRPGGASQEVLAERFGIRITRRDMDTLSCLNWLNDEIINFYMNLLMDRSKRHINLPRVYIFNTFFYPKLVSAGYASLKRWTKQIDIFSFDILLVPIHLEMHWCLAAIDFRSKTIKYYDSIGRPNIACLNALISYLQDESLDKKKKIFPLSGWDVSCVRDIPQQMNGSDCGVFACMFAEHLSRDSAFLFTQDDMPYFRKKIVLEILNRKVMA